MTIWCFIGWIPHVQKTLPMMDREGLGSKSLSNSVELLFLSSYQPSSDKLWQAMVILGTITMMFSGPAYILLLKFTEAKSKNPADEMSGETGDKSENIDHDDMISPGNEKYDGDSGVSRPTRILISYLVLALLCLIPIGINFGLLYVANHRTLKVMLPLPSPSAASMQEAANATAPLAGQVLERCGYFREQGRRERHGPSRGGVGRIHRQVSPANRRALAPDPRVLDERSDKMDQPTPPPPPPLPYTTTLKGVFSAAALSI
jgi:hypothetical protein